MLSCPYELDIHKQNLNIKNTAFNGASIRGRFLKSITFFFQIFFKVHFEYTLNFMMNVSLPIMAKILQICCPMRDSITLNPQAHTPE